jgi:uncharacterized repeat protein (TIGR04138 family)
MLCDKCNQRDAKVHITQIIGDKTTTHHLCTVCARSSPSNLTSEVLSAALSGHFDQLNPIVRLTRIIARDKRYTINAYQFVLDACSTVWEKQFATGDFTVTHVSGVQLLDVFRKHAFNTYGSDAKSTLNAWGVFKCEDFGEIVFNLIDEGLLTAQEQDSKEDFRGGFDFDTAFPDPAHE